MHRLRTILLVTAVVIGVGGCSSLKDPGDETRDWPAARIYDKGKQALDSGDYETALKYFETLEARYPFGRHAQQAQLDIAYSYYKQDEPDSAISVMDRFIRTYPGHRHLDYAYYLKGLANFDRDRHIVYRLFRKDPSHRDPSSAQQSFRDFETLLKKFPESRYADDARQRMIFLRNNLADHEIHVADYYMRRGAYVAAANRAKYVVETYPLTPAVRDALAILVRAYTKLGMDDLRADVLRVLELNYPDHPILAKVNAGKPR